MHCTELTNTRFSKPTSPKGVQKEQAKNFTKKNLPYKHCSKSGHYSENCLNELNKRRSESDDSISSKVTKPTKETKCQPKEPS